MEIRWNESGTRDESFPHAFREKERIFDLLNQVNDFDTNEKRCFIPSLLCRVAFVIMLSFCDFISTGPRLMLMRVYSYLRCWSIKDAENQGSRQANWLTRVDRWTPHPQGVSLAERLRTRSYLLLFGRTVSKKSFQNNWSTWIFLIIQFHSTKNNSI